MPHIININHQDSYGLTALHYAATHDRLDLIETLINNGANILIKDNQNKSALDYAIEKNYTSVVDYLSIQYNYCELNQNLSNSIQSHTKFKI